MHFAGPPSRHVRVVAAALLVGLASACSAAPPPAPPATANVPARTPVAGGVTLRELGLANGPQDFALPRGVRVVARVDQSNVVTLVMDEPDGPTLAAWVGEQARSGGWRVVAADRDAVVFDGQSWSAAFTGGDPSALTFRRTP